MSFELHSYHSLQSLFIRKRSIGFEVEDISVLFFAPHKDQLRALVICPCDPFFAYSLHTFLMTYKKDSPISPDKWRTRPIQPCISAHDACAPRAASPVPLRASIDVTLYIASPNTLTDSPSLHHSATIIIESSTMPAMSSPIASSPLSSSSSSIGDDDDYDSCFDSDDASHTFTTNNDWSNDEEEVHEEDFDSDTDSDTDMDASAHLTDLALSSTSLSRSFDSVSPDGTLRDLPHWWGEEDSGASVSLCIVRFSPSPKFFFQLFCIPLVCSYCISLFIGLHRTLN